MPNDTFRFNPFVLEHNRENLANNKGIMLTKHIDMLKTTFSSAFPMVGPMLYILEDALYQIYVDKDWNLESEDNRYFTDSENADYDQEVSTATFLNPLTWGDSKLEKTKDEEHYIIINGIKLNNAIEQKVLENIEKLKNAEIENWQDNIEQIKENLKELPRVSNTANKEQSDKLSLERDEIDKQIHDINKRLQDIRIQKTNKEKEKEYRQKELHEQLDFLKENLLYQN